MCLVLIEVVGGFCPAPPLTLIKLYILLIINDGHKKIYLKHNSFYLLLLIKMYILVYIHVDDSSHIIIIITLLPVHLHVGSTIKTIVLII